MKKIIIILVVLMLLVCQLLGCYYNYHSSADANKEISRHYSCIATIFYEISKFKEAETAAKKALEYDPHNAKAKEVIEDIISGGGFQSENSGDAIPDSKK